MKELMIAIAKTIPMDLLRAELNKALDKHEQDPSKETEGSVSMWLYMVNVRFLFSKQSIEESIAEVNEKTDLLKEIMKVKANADSR